MKLIKGDPKDLIWKEYHPHCPYCEEPLRISQLDMGSNHSLYHSCRPKDSKDGNRYQYHGRMFDLRKVRDE